MWLEELLGLGLGVCVIILVLSITKTRGSSGKADSFPPGPSAWPIIGHLHLFSDLPHQRLREVSRIHGHIVGLLLGQKRAVVVSSPELAKQVLLTHDKLFADRPPFAFTSTIIFGSTKGLIFSRYGPLWRKGRKFCMLHLFTAKRMQELQPVRQEEMGALLRSIYHHSSACTRPVNLGLCVGAMSSRLLMRLLWSRASTHVCDEDLQQLMKEAEQEAVPTMGDLIPFLSWLDFVRKQRMRRLHARLDKVYSKMLMECKENVSLQDSLLHSLLSEEEPLSVTEIKAIISDLLAAGIHTTALTLEWAMAELLRNPRCFHRLQKEIEAEMGEKKQISDEDLPNLSFLRCVVKETFRLHPVAPLLVPRISMEECQIQGYTIPAETLVFVNVWAIGRDEQVWPNANDFMPERFEASDIDFKGQHFELLPFGSGRRSCLGLPLAMSTVGVTLANLVSCFDWELPDGEAHTSINMDEKKGLTANKAAPVLAIPKLRLSLNKLHS